MFELVDSAPQCAMIKVIGVGGGGGNAVEHMVKEGISGVEFVATNTDAQALATSPIDEKLMVGRTVTRGLSTGGEPELGKQAADVDVTFKKYKDYEKAKAIIEIMAEEFKILGEYKNGREVSNFEE